jgi:hypothetical protein
MKEVAVDHLDPAMSQYPSYPCHLEEGVGPDKRVGDIPHPRIENGHVQLSHTLEEMGGIPSVSGQAAEEWRKAPAIQEAQHLQQVDLCPADRHPWDYIEDRDRIHDGSAAFW